MVHDIHNVMQNMNRVNKNTPREIKWASEWEMHRCCHVELQFMCSLFTIRRAQTQRHITKRKGKLIWKALYTTFWCDSVGHNHICTLTHTHNVCCALFHKQFRRQNTPCLWQNPNTHSLAHTYSRLSFTFQLIPSFASLWSLIALHFAFIVKTYYCVMLAHFGVFVAFCITLLFVLL